MLGTRTLGLGTAVSFCKEAEQAAEQGGEGLSRELAFMLNPCDKRIQSARSITLFPLSQWVGLSAWSLQAGLQPRQHEHLVEEPEATPCHKKPADTQGRCGDLTRHPGTLTRTENLTPTGLIQAGVSVKPGTVFWEWTRYKGL